jgi:hypothetical protein
MEKGGREMDGKGREREGESEGNVRDGEVGRLKGGGRKREGREYGGRSAVEGKE